MHSHAAEKKPSWQQVSTSTRVQMSVCLPLPIPTDCFAMFRRFAPAAFRPAADTTLCSSRIATGLLQ